MHRWRREGYTSRLKMAPPMGRAGMHQEPGHTWVGSALSGQRLQEPALEGYRCTKPIGLGNCPVSIGRASSCMPHVIGSGFRPYCWRRGQGRSSPAPLPFGENGVPRGSASWSRPQAAKTECAMLASPSGLIYDPDTHVVGVQLGVLPAIPAKTVTRFPRETWCLRAFAD